MPEPRNKPRWNDQPVFSEFYQLAEMLFETTMIQVADVVYEGERGIAISAGNLFGSQTILVPDAREALVALGVLFETLRNQSRCKTEEQVKKYTLSVKGTPWKLLPARTKEDTCQTSS